MKRVRAKINLSDAERAQLQAISRNSTAAQLLIQRAKIILLAEENQNNKRAAKTLNVTEQLVSKWTHRWLDLKELGEPILTRLSDAKRSGKPL